MSYHFYRFIVSIFFMISATGTATAQGLRQPAKEPDPLALEGKVLLLTAAQPSSPVRFDNVQMLIRDSGKRFEISFDVRNIGTKAIRSITPVIWTSYGTGGTLNPLNELLQPGATLRSDLIRGSTNPSAAAGLKSNRTIKVLMVLLVEDVTFVDGSTYTDHETSKALLNYFEDIDNKVQVTESQDRAESKRRPR